MKKNGSANRKVSAVRSRPGQGGDSTLKSTVARDGGPRVTVRSQWWRNQREDAVAWERLFRKERQHVLQKGTSTAWVACFSAIE